MSPREIRRAARVPLIRVAADARVAEATARVYEADPSAVTAEKREALDRVYAALAQERASA